MREHRSWKQTLIVFTGLMTRTEVPKEVVNLSALLILRQGCVLGCWSRGGLGMGVVVGVLGGGGEEEE